jgi:excisionase family DNA binding protein
MKDVTFTALEVSEILGVSDQTIYNLIKEGKLGCIKVGTKIIITKQHIEEYINDSGSLNYLFAEYYKKKVKEIFSNPEFIEACKQVSGSDNPAVYLRKFLNDLFEQIGNKK